MTPRDDSPISFDDLVRAVKRHPTWDLLRTVHNLSVEEERQEEKPWRVERVRPIGRFRTREWVHVTQFDLAFLAKLSVVHSSDLRSKAIDANGLFALIALCGYLDEAFLHQGQDKFALWSFLIRTGWLQFPAQSGIGHLLPRYYAMLRVANDSLGDRRFDVPSAWEELSGLSLEDYVATGLVLWARAQRPGFFQIRDLQGPQLGDLQHLTTDERLDSVMSLAGADYEEFRTLQSQYAVGDPLYAKTEFNVLVKRPLIQVPKRGWIAPIPRLLLERITSGIFFDLADAFRDEGSRNEFLEFFGTLFEAYAGQLLRAGWGEENVSPEPRYGMPERRGPDWTVVEGERVLLFECRSSRLRLPTKAVATEDHIRKDIRRVFVDPLKKYPGKIADLTSGRTGIKLPNAPQFYPCVAVSEKIYWEHVYRDVIDQELKRENVAALDYYLIDVDQLELVSAWAEHTPVCDVFDSWREERKKPAPDDFDIWLRRKGREMSLPFESPYLRGIRDAFLREHIPTDRRAAGLEENSGP